MKQIGAEIGVNESRVSQLHARAIRRLRDALAGVMPAAEAAKAMRTAILEFQQKPRMAKASTARAGPDSQRGWTACQRRRQATNGITQPGVVVPYASVSRTARSKSDKPGTASRASGSRFPRGSVPRRCPRRRRSRR